MNKDNKDDFRLMFDMCGDFYKLERPLHDKWVILKLTDRDWRYFRFDILVANKKFSSTKETFNLKYQWEFGKKFEGDILANFQVVRNALRIRQAFISVSNPRPLRITPIEENDLPLYVGGTFTKKGEKILKGL